MSNLTTPREIDMALAAKHHELTAAEQQLAYSHSEMFSLAGGEFGYQGRKRAYFHTANTNPEKVGRIMTLSDAIEIAERNVAALKEYMEDNAYTEDHGDYVYEGTRWEDYKGAIRPYESDRAIEAFPKMHEREAEIERIQLEIDKLQRLYSGWSRFFVVTSSAGHVHKWTHCHTCRPTTTFGWLPNLSGKTEADAVAELGPALCSVCFESAPVEHQGGKLTKAQAAKVAA